MEAKVVWKGRMSFAGSSDSGFFVPFGTDHRSWVEMMMVSAPWS